MTATTKEESEQRIGATVDQRWRLEALIGHSSLAATYKARHRNGLEAALKIIHRAHCIYEGAVERFLREAHLANRVDHPGVERVLDDGRTEDGCVFLVMELLDGESLELRRACAGGKLSAIDARPIFDGLLDALIATHSASVLHRNLKPANVFLTKGTKEHRDGRVVLTDFGRGRLMDGSPQSPLSVDGLVMGTPSYMAPEQARGKRDEVDVRSDVWSAAAILFTTLTGRRVHEAKSSQEKLTLAATKPAPPIASIVPGFDPELAAVIDRALAFDKKDRWPTASEMRRAYWLATGRDAATIPEETKPGERKPAKLPPEPATGWVAMGWPADVAPSKKDERVDLLPPSIRSFTEPDPPVSIRSAQRESRSERRSRTLTIAAIVLLAGVVGGSVALVYSDDDPQPARADPGAMSDAMALADAADAMTPADAITPADASALPPMPAR